MDKFPDSTVLIVDDTPENLAAVGCFLEDLCNVVAAQSGEEALEIALRLQPDVILLDVLMPGMDGLEVLRRLQANPVTKQIAVLLVTSLSDPESKLEGFARGAVDFVSKPFLAGELRARVATQLRLRQLENELRQQIRSLNIELTEGRQNFDFLAEHTGACLLCMDAWDRIVLCNPAWESLTGKPAASAPGQLFFHLFIAEDQEMVRRTIRDSLADRRLRSCFTARIPGSPEPRTVLVQAAFPRLHLPTQHRWCAVLCDVSHLATEVLRWKNAYEQLESNYAACRENLQTNCRKIQEALNLFNTVDFARATNANDLRAILDQLAEFQSAAADIMQITCIRNSGDLSAPPSQTADHHSSETPGSSKEVLPKCGVVVLDAMQTRGNLYNVLFHEAGVESLRVCQSAESAATELQNPDVFFFFAECQSLEEHPDPLLLDAMQRLRGRGGECIGLTSAGARPPSPQVRQKFDRILIKPISVHALREILRPAPLKSVPPEISAERIAAKG